MMSCQDPRKEALLLLGRADRNDCRSHQPLANHAHTFGSVGPGELRQKDRLLDRACPATSVFFGPGNARPTAGKQLTLPGPQVVPILRRRLATIPLPGRGHMLRQPGPKIVAKGLLFEG